jgi:exopolyphosphatase/guanosine-5'-triphosphate,3'-diphosphate pyrophosphatase
MNRVFTVVDCGSTSIRAYIVEIATGEPRILEDLSHDVDLTGAFGNQRLRQGDMDRCLAALASIRQAATNYGATEMRIVATSALREAVNADVLVERVRQQLGLTVDVIETAEEARLYYQALVRRLVLEQREPLRHGIMLDVGSGSVIISLIEDGKLVGAVNDLLGTVRVLDGFADQLDRPDFSRTLDRFLSGAIRRLLTQLRVGQPGTVAITGNEVRDLAARLTGAAGRLGTVTLAAVQDWWQEQSALTPAVRARTLGTNVDGAHRLLLVGCLMRHLGEQTGTTDFLIPEIRLRDGLVTDFLPGAQGPHHLDRDHLLAAARQLAQQYGCDLAYAENTAALAEQIFDQTAHLHRLGAQDRNLLSFAAIVHDIGSRINVRNRHKHTLYIVTAADLVGLSLREKRLVAQIARYHRGSPPRYTHAEFQALPREDKVLVASLGAILRVAYGLDVERDQRIRRITCRIVGDRLLIHTDRRQISLEQWSMRRKGDLFHDVFGLEVVVLPREEA